MITSPANLYTLSGFTYLCLPQQALWFTDKPGVEGPVFGSSDQWNGLGVFFDSFDNDNKRNNPYIMAMVNDGTKIYDHEKYVE